MTQPTQADIDPHQLRGASLCQTLHWLATGRITPYALAETYIEAIEREDGRLGAFFDMRPELVREQAEAAARRRRLGVIGRLDGAPIAIKDNFDLAGWPTTAGMPGRDGSDAAQDARAVARLRAAGAVLIGKTRMDEGALGAVGANPHYGSTHNPHRHGYTAGGSSSGSAAAVAAGLAVAALGSDTLGSLRIPASYCGLCTLKPTHGEISSSGMIPAARRLDTVGVLARSVDDITVLLQVLAGYDADDPYSRHRRVALSLPDWDPGSLRAGVLPDLDALGVQPQVIEVFDAALQRLTHELSDPRHVDFSDWPFARARRAGLLLMEAEMLGTFEEDLQRSEPAVSSQFRSMLDYAVNKSAAGYVAADRMLDAAKLKARRLFSQIDVLVLPTTPQGAFPLDGPVPDNQADLTAFASMAACPAVSIPMGNLPDGLPVGLQFVGPPASDLRLLELAQICAAALDAAPEFPVGG